MDQLRALVSPDGPYALDEAQRGALQVDVVRALSELVSSIMHKLIATDLGTCLYDGGKTAHVTEDVCFLCLHGTSWKRDGSPEPNPDEATCTNADRLNCTLEKLQELFPDGPHALDEAKRAALQVDVVRALSELVSSIIHKLIGTDLGTCLYDGGKTAHVTEDVCFRCLHGTSWKRDGRAAPSE
jgi:hypothetical protein